LAAQHACEWETFSFQTLLTEFLNMNQVALNSNVRTAWSYDQEKWTSISDRAQRYERDLDPQQELTSTTWDAQKRIADGIHAKWEKEKQKKDQKQQGAQQKKGKGKGKGRDTSTFASTAASYDSAAPDPQQPRKQQKGKGKGSDKGAGKKAPK
jgi:hypothetical protein